MPFPCLVHPHSSRATAERCFAKRAGKRADRVIQRSGAAYTPVKYKQIKYEPPKTESLRPTGLVITWFYGVTK